jgi:PAS domain S-box-containing protein
LDAGGRSDFSRQFKEVSATGWRVVAASLGVAAVAAGAEIASKGALGTATTAAALAAVGLASLVGGLAAGLIGAGVVAGWYLVSLTYHGGLFAPAWAGIQYLFAVSAGALAIAATTGVLQKRSQLFWIERAARIIEEGEHRRFRELVDDLDVIAWEARPHPFEFTFVSDAAFEILGYKPAAWISDPGFWAARIHPEDRDRVVAERVGALGRLEEHQIVYRMMGADGRVVWVDDLAKTPAGRAGRATVHGRMFDITESKRVQDTGQFLEEVSTILASSLDHRSTFKALLQRAAKFFCDYCVIDSVEVDRAVRRVAASDYDEAWSATVGAFDRYLNDPEAGHPVVKALREGKQMIGQEIGNGPGPGAPSIDSYMVLPLTARGRVLGAMSFLSIGSDRRYSADDLGLAQELARRTSLALDNALRYQERSRIARILQESLLPPKLPQIPGIELGARYRAAGDEYDMGGDFYDLFAYGPQSQRWAIVIGDVSGKGSEAAALTGLVRYTVRSEAMQEREPARIVSMLNEAILEQSRQDQFCTLAYTRLEPINGGARLSLVAAGHPLPLLRRSGGQVEAVGNPGSLLGLFPEVELKEYLFDIGPGDTLLFYTDGVIEARGAGDVFGEQRLTTMLAECGDLSAAEIARNIESEVLSFSTGPRPDDLAVLVLQIPEVVRLEGAPAEHPQAARK